MQTSILIACINNLKSANDGKQYPIQLSTIHINPADPKFLRCLLTETRLPDIKRPQGPVDEAHQQGVTINAIQRQGNS